MNMVVSEARIESWNPALALKLAPLVTLDDDQLFAFCQLNRDLRIERDAEGVLVAPAIARTDDESHERSTRVAGVSIWPTHRRPPPPVQRARRRHA